MTLYLLSLLGVAVFAASGALAATGSAGGVLRDILSAEVPLLLRQSELYATAAIAGITVYLLAQRGGLATTAAALLGMAIVAAIRFAAILWRLRLPVFQVSEEV